MRKHGDSVNYVSFLWLVTCIQLPLRLISRSRAVVARRAHNPKVGSSNLPFATPAPLNGGAFIFAIYSLMKVGFVTILGRPNAGKSTLLNSLMGEKLAIVSAKIQTTRHRIKGILNGKDYQLVFSDTPGIIEPEYRLHVALTHHQRRTQKRIVVVLFVRGKNQ